MTKEQFGDMFSISVFYSKFLSLHNFPGVEVASLVEEPKEPERDVTKLVAISAFPMDTSKQSIV